MKIELTEEDIIQEVSSNFRNDVNFLYKIIDEATTVYESFGEIALMMIKELKKGDQTYILERIIQEIQK